MVVCLMKITSKSRKLIGISNAVLIGFIILLQTSMVLLKFDKALEFYNIGIFQWLWSQDSLFLCSNLITCLLLLFSILLLVVVFDVANSQESDHFHVASKSYSLSIYLLFVSFILCALSYALSLRMSAEFDFKMTKLLMNNYLNYGKSRESRRLADRIHVEYSCCGVKSIDDFVDLSEIDGKLPTQTKLWSCNEWEYCGVPLSCCKSISCSQRTELLSDGWDTVNITDKWFNREGCVMKMDNAFLFFNYPNFLLTDFIMVLVLGFHLCSFLLSQIQITASATLHGAHLETSQSSYAWLLDVGQPGQKDLMKKLNPDLLPTDIEPELNLESHGETETANATELENATETEKGTTALDTTSETAGTTVESTTGASTDGSGTTGTTINPSTSSTTSVLGKLSDSSSNGASNADPAGPPPDKETPTEKNDSDAGPTTKKASTEKHEGGNTGAKNNKKAATGKAAKPSKQTAKKTKNQGKKQKTTKKSSGPSKAKNTKTKSKPKKSVAKKNTHKKKPAAKPKKK